jgi:hypothetical protein
MEQLRFHRPQLISPPQSLTRAQRGLPFHIHLRASVLLLRLLLLARPHCRRLARFRTLLSEAHVSTTRTSSFSVVGAERYAYPDDVSHYVHCVEDEIPRLTPLCSKANRLRHVQLVGEARRMPLRLRRVLARPQ